MIELIWGVVALGGLLAVLTIGVIILISLRTEDTADGGR